MKKVLFFQPSCANWRYCKLGVKKLLLFYWCSSNSILLGAKKLLLFYWCSSNSILLGAKKLLLFYWCSSNSILLQEGIFGTAAPLILYFLDELRLNSALQQLQFQQNYSMFLPWLVIAQTNQLKTNQLLFALLTFIFIGQFVSKKNIRRNLMVSQYFRFVVKIGRKPGTTLAIVK